jgi:hypothetical protein
MKAVMKETKSADRDFLELNDGKTENNTIMQVRNRATTKKKLLRATC